MPCFKNTGSLFDNNKYYSVENAQNKEGCTQEKCLILIDYSRYLLFSLLTKKVDRGKGKVSFPVYLKSGV